MMVGTHVSDTHGNRMGRPLVFSVTETVVFVLIAVALIATAAVPAVVRHPHVAEARTLSAAPRHP